LQNFIMASQHKPLEIARIPFDKHASINTTNLERLHT